MTSVTIQDLQDIAVQAVSDFFNKKIPLNTTLAKEASVRELNSEQLHRAIEATNTLTHLKNIEIGVDRTTEFPVADYKEIIKLAFVPELKETEVFDFVEKSAEVSTEMEQFIPVTTDQENVTWFIKQAARNNQELDLLKGDLRVVGEKLLTKLAELRSDPSIIDTLSCSNITNSEFEKITSLMGFTSERRELPEGFLKSANTKETDNLISLYKEACNLTYEIQKKEALKERAKQLEVLLTKKAFLGPAFASVGRLLGRTIAGSAKVLTKSTTNLGMSAAKIGAKSLNNMAAETSIGKKIGLTSAPIDPAIKKRVALAGAIGVATADSSTYKPQASVWDTLQG